MEHYDIAVIGAGPAGANFARLADSIRNRILIIDDDKQKKPCGGLLSPDAQKVLASYDISLPISVLTSPQIFAVRVLDLDNGLTRRYPRHYLNMDRAAFDDLLRSLIPETVTVIRGRCASLADTGNGFLIRLADGKEYAADRLVGADGANSLVRRTFFPEKKHSFFTAIQEISPAQSMNPFYSRIFDSEISPAPSWLLFKNGVMIFGGAFSPGICQAKEQGGLNTYETGREGARSRLAAGGADGIALCTEHDPEGSVEARRRGNLHHGRAGVFYHSHAGDGSAHHGIAGQFPDGGPLHFGAVPVPDPWHFRGAPFQAPDRG